MPGFIPGGGYGGEGGGVVVVVVVMAVLMEGVMPLAFDVGSDVASPWLASLGTFRACVP